ncbi:unnamed protein product [Thlaspi arvense]|uniref:25S rRNA (uridine-N(3))-methyltransferase BMT5-like domain-containing protein n=1 Tax=Thlaspi arvense TaxID=13288 RepID=A0AAU9RRH1_THLAR|nr:unnamed protein product [Thlaspi arvense]
MGFISNKGFNLVLADQAPRHTQFRGRRFFVLPRSSTRSSGERSLKHYSSRQSILLVGDGDFSFSASLAMDFGFASNIVATSLNTESFLRKNYRNAMSNIQKLTSRGAKVLHEVDATEMATHPSLRDRKFDRIIFNFPLSGFFHNESAESVLRRHRELVRLFMANAKKMMGSRGEIHITHKSSRSYKEWQLEELGSSEGLRLIKEVPFNRADYPGYENKYGFGVTRTSPATRAILTNLG